MGCSAVQYFLLGLRKFSHGYFLRTTFPIRPEFLCAFLSVVDRGDSACSDAHLVHSFGAGIISKLNLRLSGNITVIRGGNTVTIHFVIYRRQPCLKYCNTNVDTF